jgi:nicotinate dehydrogenase subunit B
MTTKATTPPGPSGLQSGGTARPLPTEDAPAIGDWLHITADGTITLFAGKAEVGQSLRASLAQAVAEELRVPVESVGVVLGDTDRTPFDFGTFGSRTTPVLAARLHKVAASARELFVDLAAAQWQVAREELSVANGQVMHAPTGRAIGYGELTRGRTLIERWSADAPVTPASDWTVAGRAVPKVDGRALVTGAHRYTSDIHRPDMLAGAIFRPPAFGATLTDLDTSTAEAMPGVTIVRDGDFVGLTAPTRQAALRARAAIRADWDVPEHVDQADLFAYLKSHPAPVQTDTRWGGATAQERGSLEEGRAAAAHTLEAAYTVAYIAHAPLEARAAVAEWEGDHLTVWTGTQRPFGVRGELAQAFGLSEEQVRVIVPDTGGAYGGKHTGEVAIEAARLARAAGHPVQLVWTREEEFTWAYFRPAALIEVRSAVRADGTITAWEYDNYNSGPAGIEPPYAIPNQRVAYQPSETPLRQGSYRALAATANHFARETHIDELAQLVGMDPLAFRLKNTEDPRLRAVLEAAATQFGWGTRTPAAGHGYGIAGGTEKGSYVATCAEVVVDPESSQVRLMRVVEAFECGAIVNPEGLQNQVEGAVTQAIGGALFEQINFADGTILTDRFSRYRVPRFADVPAIETVLLDRRDLSSAGAGETPIVGLAPAVGNAIFAATGVRRRAMPLAPSDPPPA